MDLHEFLNRERLTLPEKDYDDWRVVALDNQRPSDLRGQPHQGTVTPLATDGIYAFVRRWHDQMVIKVMATNVIFKPKMRDFPGHAVPRTKPTTLAEAEPAKPRKRKHSTNPADLLADFM